MKSNQKGFNVPFEGERQGPPFPLPLPDATRWFAEEVQPHESALRAYLRRSFPLLPDCDDVVQEAYIRLLRAHGRRAVHSPKALLFATARNVAIDCYRLRRVEAADGCRSDFERIAAWEVAPGADEAQVRERELRLLEDAIQSLPGRCREIILLRKIEGLSYQTIAARLGISPHTISAHITAGVRRCRDYLRAHGVAKGSP